MLFIFGASGSRKIILLQILNSLDIANQGQLRFAELPNQRINPPAGQPALPPLNLRQKFCLAARKILASASCSWYVESSLLLLVLICSFVQLPQDAHHEK